VGNIYIDEGSKSEHDGLTRLVFNLSGDVYVSGQIVAQINASSSLLLPLDLVEKAGGYVLIYDIGDRISLSKYLRNNKVDIPKLIEILKNINSLISLCKDKQLYVDNLSFFADYVFCDISPFDIRFVYLPYETGADGMKSCKTLINRLLDEAASGFEDKRDMVFVNIIRDYVIKPDFDIVEFGRILNRIDEQQTKGKPKKHKLKKSKRTAKSAKPAIPANDIMSVNKQLTDEKHSLDGTDSFFKRMFGGGKKKRQPETQETQETQETHETSQKLATDLAPAPIKHNMTQLLISHGSAMTTMLKQGNNRFIQFSVDYQGYPDKILLDKFPCTVGRSKEDSDILVEDKSVSRKHAIVECTDGKYSIIDCNSSNGIQLNGSLISPGIPYALKIGDEVKLGRVDMKVTSIGCK
jgi:hypothetical protein